MAIYLMNELKEKIRAARLAISSKSIKANICRFLHVDAANFLALSQSNQHSSSRYFHKKGIASPLI